MVSISPSPTLYLASTSPRRHQLLAQLGVFFHPLPPPDGQWCDETPFPDESPTAHVERLALTKAAEAHRYLRRSHPALPLLTLAADTIVTIDGLILGKPRDAEEARATLQRLSGRTHAVLTAVALTDGKQIHRALSVAHVSFAPLPPAWIDAYIASGEPFDKAGAYGYQGAAAAFIPRIDGSASGIIGLPLYETAQLLARFGLGPHAASSLLPPSPL
ncbi:MAG: Maf family nucleotide pyrophosphatase [Hydrogenophilus sp.]|nr:Maf family nucleotide pyrophosphatase [Hydrogenophilus sp.]